MARTSFVRWLAGPLIRAAFLLLAACPALADQITVDPRGNGDVTTLQAAHDLAEDGDVIVVRPGTYEEFVAIEKGLWIVSQQPGTVLVEGQLSIAGLSREQELVIVGMHIEAPALAQLEGTVHATDCEGPITLHGCVVVGLPPSAFSTSEPALRLEQTVRASLVDCELRTPDVSSGDATPHPPGADAIELVDSRACVWGSTLLAGEGANTLPLGGFPQPTAGGSGVVLQSSQLFVSGSDVRGGDGGDHSDFFPLDGADGGDAVRADADSSVFLVETNLVAGEGGRPAVGGTPGADGQVLAGEGAARFLPGATQNHEVERWTFANREIDLALRGDAGARARLFLVTERAPFLFDAFPRQGSILAGQDFALASVVADLGAIPPTGELAATIQIPALPAAPGLATGTFFAITGPAHRALFGAPMPFVALNCDTLLPDCDGNGVSDLCEILQGLAPDANQDGVLDGCGADCNGNGVIDSEDLLTGFSEDLNGNLVPDECEPVAATWHVDPAAGPGGDGSAAAPFASLLEARGSALPGHEILLADGLYTGPGNRDVDFPYAGVTLRSGGNPFACVFDLESQGRAVTVQGPGTFTVRGITFRGGLRAGSRGGALLVEEASLVVSECIFEDNHASGGGAIAVSLGTADVRRSRFLRNVGQGGNVVAGGGALSFETVTGGGAVIEECLFQGNRSPAEGGAMFIRSAPSGVLVSRCRFLSNGQFETPGFGQFGGGISIRRASDVEIDGCLFAGNIGGRGGAVWGAMEGSLTITSSTFADNTAGTANAIEVSVSPGQQADLRVANCVIKDPVGGTGNIVRVVGAGGTLDMHATTLVGGASALRLISGATLLAFTDIVDADPLFADPLGPDGVAGTTGDNDYSLGPGSPSIDAGDNGRLPADRADADDDGDVTEPVPFDVVGNPRRVDDPAAADTGSGTARLVDHGAYERQ